MYGFVHGFLAFLVRCQPCIMRATVLQSSLLSQTSTHGPGWSLLSHQAIDVIEPAFAVKQAGRLNSICSEHSGQ